MNATCTILACPWAMGGQMARRARAEMRHSKVIEKRMMVKEKEIITNAYECMKFLHELRCGVVVGVGTSQLRLKGRPTYVPVP